jgi:hypothetical protein
MEYVRIGLMEAIKELKNLRHTNPTIGEQLGVTPLQVHYYGTGKTKQPNPEVCMRFFTQFKLQGKHILLDLYEDVEDLTNHYDIYMVSKNG